MCFTIEALCTCALHTCGALATLIVISHFKLLQLYTVAMTAPSGTFSKFAGDKRCSYTGNAAKHSAVIRVLVKKDVFNWFIQGQNCSQRRTWRQHSTLAIPDW